MKELADELHYAACIGDAFASLCVRDARSFEGILADIEARHRFEGPTRLYAVVDTAKLPGFLDFAAELPVEARCLLTAGVGVDIRHVAAHLISLPDRRALKAVFRRTWGRQAAIFLQSRKTSRALATHLRQFSIAEKPNGDLSIFRYYDPRVFRAFIENVIPAQYKAVFPDYVERAFFEDSQSALVVADFPASGPEAMMVKPC